MKSYCMTENEHQSGINKCTFRRFAPRAVSWPCASSSWHNPLSVLTCYVLIDWGSTPCREGQACLYDTTSTSVPLHSHPIFQQWIRHTEREAHHFHLQAKFTTRGAMRWLRHKSSWRGKKRRCPFGLLSFFKVLGLLDHWPSPPNTPPATYTIWLFNLRFMVATVITHLARQRNRGSGEMLYY